MRPDPRNCELPHTDAPTASAHLSRLVFLCVLSCFFSATSALKILGVATFTYIPTQPDTISPHVLLCVLSCFFSATSALKILGVATFTLHPKIRLTHPIIRQQHIMRAVQCNLASLEYVSQIAGLQRFHHALLNE